MNVKYLESVGYGVDKLHEEECCGCMVNHPIYCWHKCLMLMWRGEGWIRHSVEANEPVIEDGIFRKQLTELRLSRHNFKVSAMRRRTGKILNKIARNNC